MPQLVLLPADSSVIIIIQFFSFFFFATSILFCSIFLSLSASTHCSPIYLTHTMLLHVSLYFSPNTDAVVIKVSASVGPQKTTESN